MIDANRAAGTTEDRNYQYNAADKIVSNSGLTDPVTLSLCPVVGGRNLVYPDLNGAAPGQGMSSGRLHAPISICGVVVSYDANGEMRCKDVTGQRRVPPVELPQLCTPACFSIPSSYGNLGRPSEAQDQRPGFSAMRRILSSQPSKTRSRESGFVLIAIIWVAGLLAVSATALTVSMRSHILQARNVFAGTQASEIAGGLTRLTALSHSSSFVTANTAPRDGTWKSCLWDEHLAWIAVQDQSGLVDLNTASPSLLESLLTGLGLPDTEVARLRAAMRDYRDADRDFEGGGSQPEFYPGRAFGPKNAPFAAVEELDQLPGMTLSLFSKLSAVTTVYSQQPGISAETAPDALLSALKLDRQSAATSPFAGASPSDFHSITTVVHLKDGTRFVRRAIVRKVPQQDRPFIFVRWDTGSWPEGLPAEPAGSAEPCVPYP